MALSPVTPYRGAHSVVVTGGTPVDALFGPLQGGFITNPSTSDGQGIDPIEVLFVDIVGPAALVETATTVPIQPGQTMTVPPGQTTNVSVNAATSGHKFSVVALQPPTPFPPAPIPGPFPPDGPTSILKTIPSYLYRQYADDADLQAFVRSYNEIAQQYVDWFNTIGLPIYTGPLIAGTLLDWVGTGLYGVPRPELSSGRNRNVGPYNTFGFNQVAFNQIKIVGPNDVVTASDDIYKRVITWRFFKGDGRVFNIRWLKRRIMRFLLGVDGVNVNVDQTYSVSVTFGIDNQVNINLFNVTGRLTGGAIFNGLAYNRRPFNGYSTQISQVAPLPNALILKEAIEAGVLELPFQYDFVVNTN